jgi:TolB-like protein
VKHGATVALVNLYSDEIGNPEQPKKFRTDKRKIDVVRPTAPRKSIAVLPFENLSEDKANVYFADGIHEEILTRLSRIRDLKVISRTSTQRFKNAPDNISQIASQLGVANVLEGSVRKAGNHVRVHVQLIDAESDSHLWAERYDRELIDIFAVESDIAAKIARPCRPDSAERNGGPFRCNRQKTPRRTSCICGAVFIGTGRWGRLLRRVLTRAANITRKRFK